MKIRSQLPFLIDETRGIVSIENEHHEIHEGCSFYVYDVQTKASGQYVDYVIQTGDKEMHFLPIIAATGEANFKIYEGAEIALGAAKTIFNRNRNKANGNTAEIYEPGTITTIGTEIFSEDFGISKNVENVSRIQNELVLKYNSMYLLRVTSKATSIDLRTRISWYEV